jgi:hypothetical protein
LLNVFLRTAKEIIFRQEDQHITVEQFISALYLIGVLFNWFMAPHILRMTSTSLQLQERNIIVQAAKFGLPQA